MHGPSGPGHATQHITNTGYALTGEALDCKAVADTLVAWVVTVHRSNGGNALHNSMHTTGMLYFFEVPAHSNTPPMYLG